MFAFVFDSVSGGEWLVLLAVILIIVGPKNLPSAARKVGEIMGKLRRAADEFKRQLMTMDEEMKKTADEIKKEYIDIPEDGSEHDGGSEDPYGYGYDPDDPENSGDFPDDYPDGNYDDYSDDNHGEDDHGTDDSGAVTDDFGECAEETSSPVQGSDSVQDAVPASEASAPPLETQENTNG